MTPRTSADTPRRTRAESVVGALAAVPGLPGALLATAAMRQRALILLYHRVVPEALTGPARLSTVVPTVTTTELRQQLEELSGIGDIVPLSALLQPSAAPVSRKRVRFAVTFDDDEPSHARHVLPVLQSLGLPATFFLCGRALHGLGAPWWVVLEHHIARVGLARAAAALGVVARSAMELAALYEGTSLVEVIERTFDPPPAAASVLSRAEIAALGAAPGVTIGFHTVAHPLLTTLDDAALGDALRKGRAELAAAVGQAVEVFAYPHGRCDARVARAVREAGFSAACRSGQRPVGRGSDQFRMGRWEPGAVGAKSIHAPTDIFRRCQPLLRRSRRAGGTDPSERS